MLYVFFFITYLLLLNVPNRLLRARIYIAISRNAIFYYVCVCYLHSIKRNQSYFAELNSRFWKMEAKQKPDTDKVDGSLAVAHATASNFRAIGM